MNIALVIWELTIRGGTQRQTIELAHALMRKGHTVDIFCYSYNSKNTFTDLCNGLTIHAVHTTTGTRRASANTTPKSYLRVLLYQLKVYAVLLRDLFSVGGAIQELKALMEHAGSLSRFDVINLHDYQVYRLSRIISHPKIVWMMNDIQRAKSNASPDEYTNPLLALISRAIVRAETNHIDTIIVLDERNKQLVKKYYNREARVVRSGVSIDMFGEHEREYRAHDIYSIFASSIFFPWRRFEDLVDAIGILRDRAITSVQLTINGLPDRSPEYYHFICNRIEQLGLESLITIRTGLSESELRDMYTKSDIFIFPNEYQTWGLAVFEAMLAGCACIVSRGAGAHEVLTDTENALLVDPRNPKQIADAIEYLITDPEQLARIARAGTAYVRHHRSWDVYAQDMITLFAQANHS